MAPPAVQAVSPLSEPGAVIQDVTEPPAAAIQAPVRDITEARHSEGRHSLGRLAALVPPPRTKPIPASVAMPPQGPPTRRDELVCLALNIYFESRNEPREGQRAVGYVTLNRVAHPQFPKTVCGVVRQNDGKGNCQFSWLCDAQPDRPRDVREWRESLQVANEVLNNPHADPTGGALYFHQKSLRPDWAGKRKGAHIIGGHIYFR